MLQEAKDAVGGHIISTIIGGKNGEPKRVRACSDPFPSQVSVFSQNSFRTLSICLYLYVVIVVSDNESLLLGME